MVNPLCPICQTGKETYRLDPHEPFCPYILLHTGSKCPKYRPMRANRKFIHKLDDF